MSAARTSAGTITRCAEPSTCPSASRRRPPTAPSPNATPPAIRPISRPPGRRTAARWRRPRRAWRRPLTQKPAQRDDAQPGHRPAMYQASSSFIPDQVTRVSGTPGGPSSGSPPSPARRPPTGATAGRCGVTCGAPKRTPATPSVPGSPEQTCPPQIAQNTLGIRSRVATRTRATHQEECRPCPFSSTPLNNQGVPAHD